jgi:hypothetical protein
VLAIFRNLIRFRKLNNEAAMLKELSLSRIWEKIIKNEEDTKKIEASFKCIDEYTKDFQACGHLRTYGNTNAILLSSKWC